ncbi:MAG TPA: endolytic transglycosylase MltG [Sphingomicrobium sp.]|nr:endolytic transglycosylase MltG [Sphingomicrobium sp.]
MALVAWTWWGPGPLKQDVHVVIPEGSSLSSATNYLYYAGAISGPRNKFYYLARLLGEGDPVQAGEFEIPARASAAKVLDILQHGRPVVRLVTIPEGMPSILVQEKLAAIPELVGDAPLPAEGSVLPSSYDWRRGETRRMVVERMQAAMTKTLDQLWASRKPTCPISTKQEAITLASIVEKETGKASERRMVAGVYCNRLKIGMKLDADPTVIYPITKGKPLGRRIQRSELLADTGYNTYRRPGLPEGPIANPGKESIAAVLDPAPTQAIYFVADGTGGHVFADSFAEHQANVQKWYAIRRARGEM